MNAASLGCPSGLAPGAQAAPSQDPSLFVTRKGGVSRLDLQITGARCGGCLSKIENAVAALPGVTQARLNLSNGRMHVEWTGDLEARRVAEKVASIGYGATAFDHGEAEATHKRTESRLLTAMAVAGFAAGNVMFLSEPVWLGQDMTPDTRQMLHWIAALIAVPASLYAGRTFFESALASIRARRLNMDVPITLAVILALALSLYETATGGLHAYFDASVTLLFFLLIGRFLDARLRRRAYAAAHALAGMQASTVTLLSVKGEARSARAADVKAGDRLMLAAGERLAVDSEVVSGVSEVDLRLVTGEVEPVATSVGQVLHAGAVNLGSPLQVRALATADRSLMADVARMLEAGEQKKSAYRRIADKAAEIYVPWVHAIALVGFLGWLLAGATLQFSAFVAITILIITCPCAMALAAPVVQVVASGRLFRSGVFLASGDALERIAEVDHVVFDKTGTLTLGDPVLLPGVWKPADLEVAAQLARASRHPFSRALVTAAGAGPVAGNVIEQPGLGVDGIVDGVSTRLGSARHVGVEAGGSAALWLKVGEAEPVAFRFADVIRPDARETVKRLAAMGVTAEILSGDAEARVADAARATGIETWTSGASPRDKAAHVGALERAGRKVLMVGDGLNDAGVLAKAHASIAPGGAVDVARLAADCVFSGDSLAAVERIVRVSRAARGRMRENFAFSALYNVVAVPIALAGWATPLVAAIAMSASSIVVVLNALRLSIGREGAAR